MTLIGCAEGWDKIGGRDTGAGVIGGANFCMAADVDIRFAGVEKLVRAMSAEIRADDVMPQI